MLVSPPTVAWSTAPVTTWAPVLTTVITYPVMALNPFELGATQWTVAESLPPDAVTLEGAPGVVKLVSWNEALSPRRPRP